MLIPPVLRKNRLFSLVRALVSWFVLLQEEFEAYREDANTRMGLNGQVIYIEKALNDYFQLDPPLIYLSDIPSVLRMFYAPNEGNTAYVYDSDSLKVVYLPNGSENAQLKFIVNVPSSLSGRIEEIKNIVDYNKPAGRTYTINIYEYE